MIKAHKLVSIKYLKQPEQKKTYQNEQKKHIEMTKTHIIAN